MANTEWQINREKELMAEMAEIEKTYLTGEADYDEAIHAVIEKAFADLKAEVNGNWYGVYQSRLATAVEKVFEAVADCESFEEIIERCR